MDIKKNNVPNNTVTRKLTDIDAQTGNIYESVVVISRRANQIATQLNRNSTGSSPIFQAPPTRWRRLSRTGNR